MVFDLNMKKISFIGKIISDGRLTVPIEVRLAMDIKEGDLVVCSLHSTRTNVRKELKVKNE